MKKLRYRRILYLFIALLLLLPSALLVSQAISVGHFPREGESEQIRVTAPNGSVTVLTEVDPRYGAVHDLFRLTKRASASSLPKERETYLLDFVSNKGIERVKLYLATARDRAGGEYLACFVLSSEKRLYRLDLPSSHILTRVLTPSRVDWISDEGGEARVLHTYSYSQDQDAYLLIRLTDWSALTSLSHSGSKVSESFRLYGEDDQLIATVTDPALILDHAPSLVIYTVRSSLVPNAYLESTYLFALGE